MSGLGYAEHSAKGRVQHITPSVLLHTGSRNAIKRVLYVPQKEQIVASCQDGVVRVYSADTNGEMYCVFRRHRGPVNDIVHLGNDIVATVGFDGKLLTWCTTDTRLVDTWKHRRDIKSIAKLGDSRLIIGDVQGDLIILSHQSGLSLQVENHITKAHSLWVSGIAVHSNVIVSCSGDGTVKVWPHSATLGSIKELKHSHGVYTAAVSGRYIVAASLGRRNGQGGCNMHVYCNVPPYEQECVLHFPLVSIYCLKFLNAHDVVMLDSAGVMSFISLPSAETLSKCKIGTSGQLRSFTVLPDSRLALSEASGFCCIFSPPDSTRPIIDRYASSTYFSSSVYVAPSEPLSAIGQSDPKGDRDIAQPASELVTRKIYTQ